MRKSPPIKKITLRSLVKKSNRKTIKSKRISCFEKLTTGPESSSSKIVWRESCVFIRNAKNGVT